MLVVVAEEEVTLDHPQKAKKKATSETWLEASLNKISNTTEKKVLSTREVK